MFSLSRSVPIAIVSVGQSREQTIVRDGSGARRLCASDPVSAAQRELFGRPIRKVMSAMSRRLSFLTAAVIRFTLKITRSNGTLKRRPAMSPSMESPLRRRLSLSTIRARSSWRIGSIPILNQGNG
jgi:hypothetical protein